MTILAADQKTLTSVSSGGLEMFMFRGPYVRKQRETKNEDFFLKFRPGKKLVTIHTLKNLSTILLLNIHLFAIRHPAEVARVKIEK